MDQQNVSIHTEYVEILCPGRSWTPLRVGTRTAIDHAENPEVDEN